VGVAQAVTGRLYGIGVGPGDPELMTLKAVRILSEVSVVAYPSPNEGESSARKIAAAFLPAGATEIPIRIDMRPGPEPMSVYDHAAAKIAAHLDAGRDVAVLCEGDPFFYGSFAYLHARLAQRFPTTIIPGVSSLAACAAAGGQPLASRDETLAVLPATLPDAALEERLRGFDAAAILKVGRHLPRLQALLGRLGLVDRATFVAHASRDDEEVFPLVGMIGKEAPYFSMILVARGSAL
jgi:precorrin-2/cobalt-factor-2 C20-methyltransferase